MKLLASLTILGLVMAQSVTAQTNYTKDPESCTSIMVGKKATTDGSVITSHTCDSWYRTWVNMVPAESYERDTVMNIYDGRMHTEFVADQTNVKIKGQIPQARKTYAFMDTSYPCINEKQLGIGETTVSGRRDLENPKGMFMIEELQRVALQRCTTAREAIRLMGDLIKQYGYGDSGECLTIADPDEVWHFEVFGEGKDKIGGVWAAVRIPDDHVGVSATREHFILNALAPSLKLDYEAEELPISVKPDKQVSVTDVMALLRETYEGTPLDMTQNLKVTVKDRKTGKVDTIISPKANPWMRGDELNMLNGIKKGVVKSVRNIAVPQCAYSTVIQLRNWLPDAVGGVVWFSMDNPGQSPRVPVFCGITDFPAMYKICGNHRYRDDAALWHYRRANKLAAVRWGTARKVMEKNIRHFEEKGQRELPFVEAQYQSILQSKGEEAARAYLTDYTADFIGATILRWDEMANQYWIESRFGF